MAPTHTHPHSIKALKNKNLMERKNENLCPSKIATTKYGGKTSIPIKKYGKIERVKNEEKQTSTF